jgi:hypothetical protein
VGGSEVFEDDLATAETSESERIGCGGEEVGRGAMLLRETSFDGLRVVLESSDGGGRGLRPEAGSMQTDKCEGGEKR